MSVKIPNFFILGAPKCGTTSMDMWLKSHANIFMAEKEPHYFNSDHKNRKIKKLKNYQTLFDEVSDNHIAIGETSVRYLYSQQALANILHYNKSAVFIVMLRNPIDMVYSWHNQVYFSGLENVKDFETAWNLQTQRKLGKHIPKSCKEVKMLFYGDVCCLGEQLQKIYQQVPANRVHTILFDDLAKNPKKVYQSVLNFLNVKDDSRQDFPIYNSAKTYRYDWLKLLIFFLSALKKKMRISKGLGVLEWVHKKNKKIKKRPPLSPEMRQILAAYFRDDIGLLGNLIKRDLSHWLK